jgi:hypothetical protein
MAAFTTTSEKLDIGRVIQMTFTSLQHNFVRMLPLIGLFVVLPAAITLIATSTRGGIFNASYVFSPLYYANLLFGLFAWAVFQAAGIKILVADMRGSAMGLAESLRESLVHILPLFAIVILYGLAVWFGAILLLVPGIMIAVAFSVSIPARVIERTGVFRSFGRSRDLTRNNRWRITGLFLVYLVLAIVIEMSIFSLFGGVASMTTLAGGRAIEMTILLQLFGLAFGLLGLAGTCSLYAELRRMKDGVGSGDLAAVFD